MQKTKDKLVSHYLDQMLVPLNDWQALAALHMQQMEKRGDDPEVVRLVEKEAFGGPCPRCEIDWKRIEVKNHYANFHYFDPDCRCYPRCARCGSSLHREFVTNSVMPCTCQRTPGAM